MSNWDPKTYFMFGNTFLETAIDSRSTLYRILCLKDGTYFMDHTFTSRVAAERFFVEEVLKMETASCHNIQELVDFRKNFGPHLYEVIEVI